MSDYCCLEITLRKEDASKFIERVGEQPTEVRKAHGRVTLIFHQANDGLITERQFAAEQGMMFYGHHGAGDGYSAMRFASIHGEQAEHETLHGFHDLVVSLDDDGTVNHESLVLARNVLHLERQVREIMKEGPDKTYSFAISIMGAGETVEEAWEHAVEQFSQDPGDPPETFSLEDDHDQGRT